MAAFLYLMATTDGYRKVGVSIAPQKRIRQVQGGCPTAIFLEGMWGHRDPFTVEKCLHKLFHESRCGGEWFKIEKDEIIPGILSCLQKIPGFLLEEGDVFDDRPPRNSVGRPKLLSGDVMRLARELWGRQDLSARQIAAEILEKAGVKVGIRTLFLDLGHKTDAVEKAARELRKSKAVEVKKRPKRRERRVAKREKSDEQSTAVRPTEPDTGGRG